MFDLTAKSLLVALAAAIGVADLSSSAAACPAPPPVVRDLAPPRFYNDAEGSKVDPVLDREHKAAVEPLTAFLRQVVADADKAVARSDAMAAACTLQWIADWATGDGWLGQMGTKQAEYQRKWDLAGVALAYIKLKRYAVPAQRAAIEPWLVRFADAVKVFQLDPARQRNNHLYWLGLALAATSIAADSPRHWHDARLIMKEAATHIQDNGTLPLELTRGQRALHYHAFAVTPLVLMAEIAHLKGEDWYAFEGAALHRLVSLTVAGLNNPVLFDSLARTPQERPPGKGAGWLALYSRRFPERLPKQLPDVPQKHRWIGGDVRSLMDALPLQPSPRRLPIL